jgi:hypothetical protein
MKFTGWTLNGNRTSARLGAVSLADSSEADGLAESDDDESFRVHYANKVKEVARKAQ